MMISIWTPWGTAVRFTGVPDDYKDLEGGAYIPSHKALTTGQIYIIDRIKIREWDHEIYLSDEAGKPIKGYFSNLFFEYRDPLAMKKQIMIDFFGDENGPQTESD